MVPGKCQFCDGVQGKLKKRHMCVLEVRGSRKPSLLGQTQRDRVLTSHPSYGQASRNDEVTVRREEWRDLVKIGPKVENEIQKKNWFQDEDRSIKLVEESIVFKTFQWMFVSALFCFVCSVPALSFGLAAFFSPWTCLYLENQSPLLSWHSGWSGDQASQSPSLGFFYLKINPLDLSIETSRISRESWW